MATAQPVSIPRASVRHRLRWKRVLATIAALFYLLPVGYSAAAYFFGGPHEHWSRADRSSIGLAPLPDREPEALVHVYSARAHSWRGIFATHNWVALKPTRAATWERLEVIGFGVNRGRPAVRSGPGVPDGRWYGHDPTLLAQLRGGAAEAAIPRLRAAAAEYAYPKRYTAWPGPNSNTFIAHLARRVPELRVDLPATAIGKNYPVDGVVAPTPSGTGWQLTFGLAGIAVGIEEGLEIDIIGLAAGLDFRRPALRLPGIGRLGMAKGF
jgi:hypothetical protein